MKYHRQNSGLKPFRKINLHHSREPLVLLTLLISRIKKCELDQFLWLERFNKAEQHFLFWADGCWWFCVGLYSIPQLVIFFSEVAFITKKNCKVSRVQVLKYVYHFAHLHQGLRKSSFSLHCHITSILCQFNPLCSVRAETPTGWDFVKRCFNFLV